MPTIDYKGREISKEAPTWDRVSKKHTCCGSLRPLRHVADCGVDGFDKEKADPVEKRIPMLNNGKAKQRECSRGHIFFTVADDIPCPHYSSQRKLAAYVDPRLKRR